MSPYTVIAILIFVFGCVFSYAIRRRGGFWLHVALLAMWLEVQARAARDRQRAKDWSKP